MTIRNGRYLITSARNTCVAVILLSLLASTAWGQDESDLRISTLTRELKQGDSFVRWRAAKVLMRIGSYSKADIPALIEALKTEEGDISERARDALVKIGPDAVPALIKALKYRDSLAHSKAIEALTAIGPPVVPLLNRESPLRLLPRYPLHGLTLRKNTKVFHTFSECLQDDTSPPAITIIRNAGTKVFVISKCEDGSYEIYYKGSRGHVRKGGLKPTK